MNSIDTKPIVDKIKLEAADREYEDGTCSLADISKEKDFDLILNHTNAHEDRHKQDVHNQAQYPRLIDLIKFENDSEDEKWPSNEINVCTNYEANICKGVEKCPMKCACGYNFIKKPHSAGDVVIIPIKCKILKKWVNSKSSPRTKKSDSLKNKKRKIYKKKRIKLNHTKKGMKLEYKKERSCPLCADKSANQVLVDKHLRKVHPGQKPYICDHCLSSFAYKKNVYTHIVKVHLSGELKKPYACTICPKLFTVERFRDNHVNKHMGRKMHACHVCEYETNFNRSFLDHMRIHTGEKPYKCEFCNKAFRVRKSYKFHVRTHTGEKPYTCEFCGKSFRLTKSLKLHLLSHTGDRPHLCKVCDQGFRCTSELNRHLVTHVMQKKNNKTAVELTRVLSEYSTNNAGSHQANEDCSASNANSVKAYEESASNANSGLADDSSTVLLAQLNKELSKCDFCNKLFYYKGDLKHHLKKHKKLYYCISCGKSFGANSDLKTHTVLRKKCKYCGFEFSCYGLVITHEKCCEKNPHNKIIVERQKKLNKQVEDVFMETESQTLDTNVNCHKCLMKINAVDHAAHACKNKIQLTCFCCKLEFASNIEQNEHFINHMKCVRCNRLMKSNQEKYEHEAKCIPWQSHYSNSNENKTLNKEINKDIQKQNMDNKSQINIVNNLVRKPSVEIRNINFTYADSAQSQFGMQNINVRNASKHTIINNKTANSASTSIHNIRNNVTSTAIPSDAVGARNNNYRTVPNILKRRPSNNIPQKNYKINNFISANMGMQPYIEPKHKIVYLTKPHVSVRNNLTYPPNTIVTSNVSQTSLAVTNNNVTNAVLPSQQVFSNNEFGIGLSSINNIPRNVSYDRNNIPSKSYNTLSKIASRNEANTVTTHLDTRNKDIRCTSEMYVGVQTQCNSGNNIQPQIRSKNYPTVYKTQPQLGNNIPMNKFHQAQLGSNIPMNMFNQAQLNIINNNITNIIMSPQAKLGNQCEVGINNRPYCSTTIPQHSSRNTHNVRPEPNNEMRINDINTVYTNTDIRLNLNITNNINGVEAELRHGIENNSFAYGNTNPLTEMNINNFANTRNQSNIDMSNELLNSFYKSYLNPVANLPIYLEQPHSMQRELNILPNVETFCNSEVVDNNVLYSESNEVNQSLQIEDEYIDISQLNIDKIK